MMSKKMTGVLLATTAAALFSTANIAAAEESATAAQVQCSGINACKGTSECATTSNACKGMNSCKGKGWMKTSQADCTTRGGTVMDMKSDHEH